MDFQTAVKTCFSKYVTFEGRAARSEYWWFTLFNVAGQIFLGIVDVTVLGMTEITPLSSLFALALFLPGISVTVRRLHDKDRSGWWFWIVLVPIIGWLLMLYWMVTPGTEGPNRFGNDPLGGDGDWSAPEEEYAQSSIPRVGD
ncbi:DUF805 domain-containing protein [Aliiroseovarius crassostreae]|uniref:DUF805 domain-containing protein n=1 Tax=Aliiroseovarius crassostreae TaxID=154981 RepID=UPI00220E5744|nr:DUF805 domain-containing protein [Aliiroseovarius crassostreae]UWQ04265.1 DUF805 domain-containing protein [Aliiroseovarius crassostreae]